MYEYVDMPAYTYPDFLKPRFMIVVIFKQLLLCTEFLLTCWLIFRKFVIAIE